MKKLSDENTENISIVPFRLLAGSVKVSAVNYIINKHTQTVTYHGANNRHYTKVCEPKNKDISLSDISQVYIPENDIDFLLNGKNRFFMIADNGRDNFYVYKENITVCEICNKPLNQRGILCNECGIISHNKRFFFSHGFYCKNCSKSICRNCANYFSKFLIFKIPLCNDCIKKARDEGRKCKKYKPLKFN